MYQVTTSGLFITFTENSKKENYINIAEIHADIRVSNYASIETKLRECVFCDWKRERLETRARHRETIEREK